MMFRALTGKAPQSALDQMARLCNSAAIHIALQVKDAATYHNPRKTFDLTSEEERSRLRSSLGNFMRQLPPDATAWPSHLRHLDERLDDPTADLYDIAAVHMLLGLLKTEYACQLALQYPRDKRLLEMAFKLVSMNFGSLDYIIRDKPGEMVGGIELPSSWSMNIMSRFSACEVVQQSATFKS